jgi:hypothetical protein
MNARFYFHTASDEPQHTFIQLPASLSGSTFSGWGPKI